MAKLHSEFDELFGPLSDEHSDEGEEQPAGFEGDYAGFPEPAAAERAYYLVTEAEEHVGDGDYAVAVEMLEEAMRLNPNLRASNGTLIVWGMAFYGIGDWDAAAKRFLEFASSELAKHHGDRDDAAYAMNELGNRFMDTKPKLARSCLRTLAKLLNRTWNGVVPRLGLQPSSGLSVPTKQ